ncbi:MAG TPA: amidohydrolase family protein [Segeticoccus sp.]|uniref:amidohydrolase family protein n=1 Tax=Segeticoccus sp. TaxID=2706531 RepID=UPI002D7FC969|nr:amidohydrolase family protein [Segeticoccus sp.]HET8599955.1 amidohydrolase family protein [Segeticoccus sp.]
MTAALEILDAHLHVWDLTVSDYAWLTPEHGDLHASFPPPMARERLEQAGVASAILVQAEDSERDTTYLLDVADHHPWVAGVVGWIRLDDPTAAARQLDRWTGHPAFCGVRHLVHDDPRDDFLSLPEVRSSLALLPDHGLPFDVPDAWPRHLAAAVDLARALPQLTVVLDHLGKPPTDPQDRRHWADLVGELADCPNTVAKLSGLQSPDRPFTAEAVRPAWDVALEAFGPHRLMYGGDWPMTTASGDYPAALAVARELTRELSPSEQQEIFAGTARRVYHRQTVTTSE